MKNIYRRERGYSLAEIMVATAIFAIIILAALTIYDRSNRVFKRGVESSNLQQNTRVAFEKMAADLRMTGFDFDRDGIPTGSGATAGGTNQYQQTDEQFEYIGPAAVTIRANFDYETENQPCTATLTENCDNGREGTTYESAQFPVVTTGNDEIVTYALVPDSQSLTSFPACDPTTNCIQFYADTHVPRSSYPGGQNENVVRIKGVDLCNGGCNNPPYTLYRFTFDRTQSDFSNGVNGVARTPLASNIRSLSFKYFQDAQGTDPLKDLPNTVDVSTGATIKGEGQWMQANPGALVANREIRAKINSMRMVLIGMNETPDGAYTDPDPNETIAAMKKYRKYRLETLIAPRNIQKRGMREQDTIAPGAPTDIQYQTGYCGGIMLKWTAPAVNPTQGAPDQYKIMFGKTSDAGYPCETTTFTNTWAYVFGSTACGAIEPATPYKFAVVALNSYGSGTALLTGSTSTTAPPLSITPLNATKMDIPAWGTTPATTSLNGKITLSWLRPQVNVSGSYTGTMSPSNQTLPAGEILGYEVQRNSIGASGPWPPGPGTMVNSAYDTVTWDDTTVANCVQYWYRIRAVERCFSDPTFNNTGTTAIGASDWSSTQVGQAQSSAKPDAVQLFTVANPDPAFCNGLGQCDAKLSWSKVTQDENGVPISVLTYHVWRKNHSVSTWPPTPQGTVTLAAPPAGATQVTYTDPSVTIGGGEQYDYKVTAVQCQPPTADGNPSPIRLWPCLMTMPVAMSSTAFDGDGSAATPWLFNDSAAVTVTANPGSVTPAPAPIAYVRFRVFSSSGVLKHDEQISAPGPYTSSWTIDANAQEEVAATIVDTGGCTKMLNAVVQDEPSNCCLQPVTFNAGLISFQPGNDYVDITLNNVCDSTLALNSVTITWDQSKISSTGNPKLSTVDFPAGAGTSSVSVGVTTTPVTVAAPSGTTVIPTGAPNTYKIRVHFSKNPNANPITGFAATYVNGTNTQSCAVQTAP